MMSPNMLERASDSFRRGYYDGYGSKTADTSLAVGTFGRHDYDEGYKAGAKDFKFSGLVRCSKCGLTTSRDSTYGDLCYRCCRASNE